MDWQNRGQKRNAERANPSLSLSSSPSSPYLFLLFSFFLLFLFLSSFLFFLPPASCFFLLLFFSFFFFFFCSFFSFFFLLFVFYCFFLSFCFLFLSSSYSSSSPPPLLLLLLLLNFLLFLSPQIVPNVPYTRENAGAPTAALDPEWRYVPVRRTSMAIEIRELHIRVVVRDSETKKTIGSPSSHSIIV